MFSRPSLVAALASLIAMACSDLSPGAKPDAAGSVAALIGGTDDRQEPWAASDTLFARDARDASAAIFDRQRVKTAADGTVTIDAQTLAAQYEERNGRPLCADEAFASQPAGVYCSATLIAPDLVLTAGHCVADRAFCGGLSFVFGREMGRDGQPLSIDASDVYDCGELVLQRNDGTGDFAIVRLDRPVADRRPAALLRDGDALHPGASVSAAGFPLGVPLKLVTGGTVRGELGADRTIEPHEFAHDLDTFPASSGSGTYLTNGRESVLAGVLVAVFTDTEFVTDVARGCDRTTRLDRPIAVVSERVAPIVDALCASLPDAHAYPALCGCGDGQCEADARETALSCGRDCGSTCGDGACTLGETPRLCSADCGRVGDGLCEPGESACPDCACAAGHSCESDVCTLDTTLGGSACASARDISLDSPFTLHLRRGQTSAFVRLSLAGSRRVRIDDPLASDISFLGANCAPVASGRDRVLGAGSYVVELHDGSTVDAVDPGLRDGRSCTASTVLGLEQGTATVHGDTSGFPDFQACDDADLPQTCAGPDAHYSFELTSDAYVEAEIEGFPHVALSLTPFSCATTRAPDAALAVDRAGTGRTQLARLLRRGRYALVVDGEQPFDHGPFALSVRLAAPEPRGEGCDDALPITPRGHITLTGDTSRSDNDRVGAASGACTLPSFGDDRVYRFTLTESTRVTTRVHGEQFAPHVVLTNACAAPALSCSQHDTALTRRLDPGTYFVWVDSQALEARGPYTLELDFAPATPSADERCDGATEIAARGSVQLEGDLTGAHDDVIGCGLAGAVDRVYAFTLAETRTLSVELTANGSTYVGIKPGDCANDAVACDSGSLQPSYAHNVTLTPGRYFVIVESSQPGPYTLRIDFESTARGESCDDPLPLTVSSEPTTTEVTGGASYGTTGCGFDVFQPGRFYAFDLADAARVTLATSHGTPVGVQRHLGESLCEASAGRLERSLLPGRYCVEVRPTSTEPVTLTASRAPYAGGEGMACADAIPFPQGSTFWRSYPGGGGFDDIAECGRSGRPERVFRVDVATPSTFSALANGGVHLVLGAGDCDTFQPLTSCDGAAGASVARLEPGTYYLVAYDLPAGNLAMRTSLLNCDRDGDGVCDRDEGCPNDPHKTQPGLCGCGQPDDDRDGDTTPDCRDGCPEDPAKAAPGVCGCGISDVDTDGDTRADCTDPCPGDALKTEPGACGCGVADSDADGDRTPDCHDACPSDASKVAPGSCGCGVADVDTDRDGALDCHEECDGDPNKRAPGTCGCGASDRDGDGDGVADCQDGCPQDGAKQAAGACGCGVADTDRDHDGTLDCRDGCADDTAKSAPGVCGCGVPDVDQDHDGSADCVDLCANDPAKSAPGTCGCGVSDRDQDGDRLADCLDGCPDDRTKREPGVCGCGTPDLDTDGDQLADCRDLCPRDPDKVSEGLCGCGVSDVDSDADSKVDCQDGCPSDGLKTEPGVCGCGTADVDGDGDGVLDCQDLCRLDHDKREPGVCGCGVSDGDRDHDGALDCQDACPDDADKRDAGQCGCGVPDGDGDRDGVPDCDDGCPADADKSEPDVCGCGEAEFDMDGDGLLDCQDGCPEDATKQEPGVCGCGQPEPSRSSDTCGPVGPTPEVPGGEEPRPEPMDPDPDPQPQPAPEKKKQGGCTVAVDGAPTQPLALLTLGTALALRRRRRR